MSIWIGTQQAVLGCPWTRWNGLSDQDLIVCGKRIILSDCVQGAFLSPPCVMRHGFSYHLSAGISTDLTLGSMSQNPERSNLNFLDSFINSVRIVPML